MRVRGGPTTAPRPGHFAMPTIRGGPSWQFPGLQHDLLVIGAALAGVVLCAGAGGAAVGAWIARRLGWGDG